MKLLRGKKYIVYLIISLVILTLSPLPAISQQNVVASKKPINWDVWPYNHWPEADPKPGDPYYVEPLQLPDSPQPEGLTDEELRKIDPIGYKALKKLDKEVEKEAIKEALSGLGDGISTLAINWLAYTYFTLVPSAPGTNVFNGYRGTFYFRYKYVYDSVWFTKSWPARSGNNVPSNQNIVGVGPIPQYDWTFGYMYSVWRGYEPDSRDVFSPGKWRLDPWTGGPYGRSYFETHGGINASYFNATLGCIRLYPQDIYSSTTTTHLKWYYDYRMDNKQQSPCLAVRY